MPTLRAYNLSEVGVNVDADNLHVPMGAFRQAQNIHRTPSTEQGGSIISRRGLNAMTPSALSSGPIAGGVVVPAFEAGDGAASLLLGFGD